MKIFTLLVSLILFLTTSCSFDQSNHRIDTLMGRTQIELGMSMEDVRIMVGKPDQVTEQDGITKWHYKHAKEVFVFEDGELAAISSVIWQHENSVTIPQQDYLCDQYNQFGNFPSGGGCNSDGCWVAGGNCNQYGCSYTKDACTSDGCHTPMPSFSCIYGSKVRI